MTNEKTNHRAKELRVNQTQAEALLWELLRGKQLCGLKFRRQHPVPPYYADFACMSKNLIVELDGGYHDQTCKEDFERQKYLESKGWRVLRFANDDILSDVEAATRAIASSLGLEYKLNRRPPRGSGMMSSQAPTRSLPSGPSRREG